MPDVVSLYLGSSGLYALIKIPAYCSADIIFLPESRWKLVRMTSQSGVLNGSVSEAWWPQALGTVHYGCGTLASGRWAWLLPSFDMHSCRVLVHNC